MPSGGAPPGRAPPPPGSLPPVSGSGTPTPRPARDVPYTSLFLRGIASLSRSKPDACSLVPRGPLWVSSARSPHIPASPFLMLPRFARCFHRGCLATLAPAMRFFPHWTNVQANKSHNAIKKSNHFRNITKMAINIDTLC